MMVRVPSNGSITFVRLEGSGGWTSFRNTLLSLRNRPVPPKFLRAWRAPLAENREQPARFRVQCFACEPGLACGD